MFTGVYQSGVILTVLVAYYFMDFWLISRYDRQRRASGSGRCWDYALMILAAVGVIVIQPIILSILSLTISGPVGLLLQAAGVALVIGGLVLHGWARLHLQQFYAER